MRLFKPKYRGRDGKKHTAEKWYAEITDHMGTRRRFAGFPDRAATNYLGQKIERLVAHKATGEPLPVDLTTWLEGLPQRLYRRLSEIGLLDRARAGGLTLLAAHLAAYEAHLNASGVSPRHIKLTVARAQRVIEGGGFRRWPDLTAGRVLTFLDGLRGGGDTEKGIGAQTFNLYLSSCKAFCAWAVRDGRLSRSPLEHAKPLNTRTDRRRVRRALSVEEIGALLTATAAEPERFTMTGPRRALLYRLAIETGLRASELDSLTRASFDLSGERPTVRVAAAYSKHRRDDVVPLRPDTAAALGDAVAQMFPQDHLFGIHDKGARTLRADLKAARGKWIADAPTAAERRKRRESDFCKAKDASGRVLDFHSLRHTTASLLAASGAHPSVAQGVMRHSTVELTMNAYTHAGADAERAAVAALPELRATGTDGENCLAVCLPNAGAEPCNSLQSNANLGERNEGRGENTERSETTVSRRPDASGGEGGIRTRGRGLNPFNSLANCRFRPLSHLSGRSSGGPAGIRTPDQRIMSPLL